MKPNIIKMTRVYLNNWYQFEDEIIKIGECNLFTGDNQVGKTTALDAIKYCFNGDTEFNVASDVGKRTMVGYTKCLLSNSTQEYKRKEHIVTTQIAIEFFNPDKNKYFINGACIRTVDEDTDTLRYQLKEKKLEDIIFKEKNANCQYEFLDRKTFGLRNEINFEKANDGTGFGLDMMGLDIHEDYTPNNPKIASLKRIINSIIAYKPKAKIDDFIRNNVLSDNPVDLHKVRKITNKIESIQKEMEEVVAHQQSLFRVVSVGEEAIQEKARYDINIGTVKRFTMLTEKEKNESMAQKAQNAKVQLKKDEEDFDKLSNLHMLRKEEDFRIRQALNGLGGGMLNNYRSELSNKESDLIKLEGIYKKSDEASKNIVTVVNAVTSRGKIVKNDNILKNLLDENISAYDKLNAISYFKNFIKSEREQADRDCAAKYNDISAAEEIKRQINETLTTLNRHNLDSFIHNDIKYLRDAINREFNKRQIPCKAKFLYEYILGITDESWRNALESYLGGSRYFVFVPTKYYDIAFEVFKGVRGNSVLIKSNLLEKKDVKPETGSIVDLISVEEALPKKFLQYRLGHILQCDDESVKTTENGLTKTGILSQSLTDRKINLNVKDYCLGDKAYQLNIDKQTKELHAIEEKISVIKTEMNEFSEYSSMCHISAVDDIDFNIKAELVEMKSQIASLQLKIKELSTSMKKNNEIAILLEQQRKNDEEILEIENNLTSFRKKLRQLRDAQLIIERDAESAKIKAEEAVIDYDKFIHTHIELEERILSSKQPPINETINRNQRRAVELEKKFKEEVILHGGRYNNEIYGNELGDEIIVKYKDKVKELEIKDLAIKRKNLEDQRRAMNHTFKTEFVTAIANNVSECIQTLNTLSLKLKTIGFSSEYSFKYSKETDSKMSAILKLGEYQKDSVTILDFMNLEKVQEMEQLEAELEEYLKEIIDKNDEAEIKRLSDYRQYMTYDLEIKNEKYGEEKVSLKKEIQTESGAGTQIPYLVILTASLMTVYDKGIPNCTRLMLIDEPFEKMGEENVKTMMSFLKDNFQLIMCAPDTQLHLLSKYCDQINAVHQMEGGRTRMFEETFKR